MGVHTHTHTQVPHLHTHLYPHTLHAPVYIHIHMHLYVQTYVHMDTGTTGALSTHSPGWILGFEMFALYPFRPRGYWWTDSRGTLAVGAQACAEQGGPCVSPGERHPEAGVVPKS